MSGCKRILNLVEYNQHINKIPEKRVTVEELKKEPITTALILINVIVFIVVEATGGSENAAHMLECGAIYAPLVLEQGEWSRIFASMFLHFGLPHLVTNMLVLFVLGQRLEPIAGKVRFLIIYILGGLGGNLISLYFDIRTSDFTVSAGASGAVFAVMGGLIYVLLRHKGRVADLTVKQMAVMAGFSLYFGFASGGVDNAAHLGGLICGFIAATIFYHPRKI